jgi:hypothetical protein
MNGLFRCHDLSPFGTGVLIPILVWKPRQLPKMGLQEGKPIERTGHPDRLNTVLYGGHRAPGAYWHVQDVYRSANGLVSCY